jgi:hypothetical protein
VQLEPVNKNHRLHSNGGWRHNSFQKSAIWQNTPTTCPFTPQNRVVEKKKRKRKKKGSRKNIHKAIVNRE